MSQQLTEIQMTKEEAEALQHEGNRLDQLLKASDKFVRAWVEPPAPGSPMDKANQADLREAYDMAYALIFSAEDHLRTLLLIMKTGPLPGFALYTLLRPAAEAALRCRHLVDPGLTDTQRLARGMNERLDNLKEQLKVDREIDPVKAQQHFDARVANLETRATANGITPLRKSAAHPIHAFDEPQKTDLDLFALYLPGGAGSATFRLLSAYLHSKPWVWVRRDRAQPSADPKMALVATDLNVLLFVAILHAILDIHDGNIGFWLKLAGYPISVWTDAKKGSGS
jgi:hypothetical protein